MTDSSVNKRVCSFVGNILKQCVFTYFAVFEYKYVEISKTVIY